MERTTPGTAGWPSVGDAPALHGRITRWMARADERLHRPAEPVGDRAMLREALDLAAEELRAESEARREGAASAERALHECRHLLDAVPVALVVTDRDGRMREANVVASRLLGLAATPLRSTLLVRFVSLAERPAFRAALGGVVPGGPPRELPLRLQHPERGAVPVVATVRSVGSIGDVGGERLLYWAVREDPRADEGDLL